jgi:hypothetical protein
MPVERLATVECHSAEILEVERVTATPTLVWG